MNTETKVGAFVLGCMALLVVTVYYASHEQWGSHAVSYKTYLRYAGGVGPGSDVLFGGITVGRVNSVKAWNRDATRIEISFEVKDGTPLNEKSVAKLGSVSLMSSPAISITTGAEDAPRLKPGQAVPSQETVSLDDMTRKLSGIADGAEDLITQIQAELKGISGQTQTLLANLNDVTGTTNRRQIAEILGQVNTLLASQSPKIDRITSQMELVSRDADSLVNRMGPLVDHADATIASVNGTVAGISRTVEETRDPIKQDLAQLQSTMEQAKAVMAGIQTLVQSNQENVRQTMENIRVASENLDQLTDQVKQRPWSLVRIRQPKDRKVPQ